MSDPNANFNFEAHKDSENGCGAHCKAYDPEQSGYCETHQEGIKKGEYKTDTVRHMCDNCWHVFYTGCLDSACPKCFSFITIATMN